MHELLKQLEEAQFALNRALLHYEDKVRGMDEALKTEVVEIRNLLSNLRDRYDPSYNAQ